ncbi:hypothetical protein QFZ82_000479 [Streptomyces sp. V4I23]|nr:hypothetical protein [Streptomyces sp. V4I23]MDQ1005994.1 hypothetical protein [Streptomyces sp. V4I23]
MSGFALGVSVQAATAASHAMVRSMGPAVAAQPLRPRWKLLHWIEAARS